MAITPAQQRVLNYIKNYIGVHGYAPSYREIQRGLGFKSLNAVAKHIKQLEQRGYVKNASDSHWRALELIPVNTGGASIPFLGTVAAGTPIEAVEVPDSLEVPESFLRGGQTFALRVKGRSMIEEGIRENDIIIISRQPRADEGQTVVALVNGDATVKKFYRRGAEVELRPANSEMASIMVPASDVEIVGVVVGLLRHYR